MSIFATTKRDHHMLNAESLPAQQTVLGPGRYELERILNPTGSSQCNWLVLKGTKIGMSEGAWKQWINGVLADAPNHPNFGKPIDWDDFEIIIEEDGQIVPPPMD